MTPRTGRKQSRPGGRAGARGATTLASIMSREVIAVSPENTLREVAELLTARRITGAPVVADGKVLGVISATDIMGFNATEPGVPSNRGDQTEWGEWEPAGEPAEREDEDDLRTAYFTDFWWDSGADVLERFSQVAGPEWNVLEEHTAVEVMSRGLASLPSTTTVREAARYMIAEGVHRVLVIDAGVVVGVATSMDIVGAVADDRV